MWELGVCLNSRPEPCGNLWGWDPILAPDVRTSVFFLYAARLRPSRPFQYLGQLVAIHGQSERMSSPYRFLCFSACENAREAALRTSGQAIGYGALLSNCQEHGKAQITNSISQRHCPPFTPFKLLAASSSIGGISVQYGHLIQKNQQQNEARINHRPYGCRSYFWQSRKLRLV